MQRRRPAASAGSRREARGIDAVPGQRALARALADVVGVEQRGQGDVRLDAAVLRAVAGHAVILADRDGQLPESGIRAERVAVERVEVLHRALAVGLLADDEAALVVLDRAREDLRGGGARAIDEHDQRAFPRDARLRIVEHLDAAAGLAQLHDRPALDEQADQARRFRQVAAAVVAQVDDQRLDALRPQFVDQAAHVAGRAAEIRVALHARLEVLVEARHRDDADLHVLVAALMPVTSFFAACDSSVIFERFSESWFSGEPGRRASRQDLQPHHGVHRPADQLHDVVEPPADDVGQRPRRRPGRPR